MNLKILQNEFFNQFGEALSDTKTFFSPGRVNLIGEHIDYNGGHVFPCALTFGTYAIARLRSDDLIKVYSMNFKEQGVIQFSLNELVYEKKHDWANYIKGVTKIFIDHNLKINSGFEIIFFGNIPNGAGLSSSASIELATSILLKELFHFKTTMIDMVKMSQQAENEFIGVNCGIMDQFAIGMGKKDSAILLDCSTLEYEYAPINLKNASIVIVNSNKRRELGDSQYNERRTQCEHALLNLKEKLDINSLGDLTVNQFEEYKYLIKDATDKRRAKHAVYENQRTLKAVEQLKKGNLKGFGILMNESHASLKDDYEVSCTELDILVQTAWSIKGVIGSRMTGAGFGGCTVSIVKNSYIDDFTKIIEKIYKEKTGLEADFYIASIGDGTKKLTPDSN